MPFCTQCGCQMKPSDIYCANCGTRHSTGAPSASTAPEKDFLADLNPRTASILAYMPFVGWIACIVFLAAQRFRDDYDVRFHAFQGLYLFGVSFLVRTFMPDLFDFSTGTRMISRAAEVSLFGLALFMMYKVSLGERFHLPVLGDLAEKSASEQK